MRCLTLNCYITGFRTFELVTLYAHIVPKMALKVGAGVLSYDPYSQDVLGGCTHLLTALLCPLLELFLQFFDVGISGMEGRLDQV